MAKKAAAKMMRKSPGKASHKSPSAKVPMIKKHNFGAVVTEPGSTIRNNTGSWRTLKPIKDEKKCIKCGICWEFCPDAAISFDIVFDYHFCKGCGICAVECPVKAITMVREEK